LKISTKLFNQQQVSRFGKLNEEIQSLQNKISTGKNIVQASDDPIGAVNLSGLQQVKERFSQYSRNADNAINRLTIADTALQSVTNLMVRAKELAIQAANDTFGAQDREALALELEEMKNEMFSVANSTDSSGAFIFGGYHTKNQPFTLNNDNRIEASGGPTTCPADPAAVVIPSAKDLFSGDVALPTTAKIGPKPLPAIPKPINRFKV